MEKKFQLCFIIFLVGLLAACRMIIIPGSGEVIWEDTQKYPPFDIVTATPESVFTSPIIE